MSVLPAFPCPHPQEISGTPHPVLASASRQAWITQWQSLGPNCYSRPVPKVRTAAQVLPQVTTRTNTPAHCEEKAKWGSGAEVGASPPFPSQKVLLSDGTDGEGGLPSTCTVTAAPWKHTPTVGGTSLLSLAPSQHQTGWCPQFQGTGNNPSLAFNVR